MNIETIENIAATLAELQNSEKLKSLINEALLKGFSAAEIIEKGIRKGLEIVGKKYETGEYFLAELLFAGVIVSDALKILKSHLKSEDVKKIGKIVLGTVKGDIHDIGKNIFKILAEISGFEVYDLGVDIEPEVFVKKIKEMNAEILGLSALLTTTIWEMKNVINKLEEAGIRNKVKVLLGGNAVTKEFAKEIRADDAALNAVEGIEICKKWVEKDYVP